MNSAENIRRVAYRVRRSHAELGHALVVPRLPVCDVGCGVERATFHAPRVNLCFGIDILWA